jgi:hypothetical protein
MLIFPLEEIMMHVAPAVPKALDRDFLGIRCRLIELAAAFDRIERHGGAEGDPRTAQIQEILKILADGQPDRAVRVQMAFTEKGARD